MGFLKASMEPQDQAQITFRSEIHSIVFKWVRKVIVQRKRFLDLVILAQYTVCPKKDFFFL